MAKKGKTINRLIKRAADPRHLWKAYKTQKNKNETARSYDDPQLKLIVQLCPGDFLNYGYFENPNVDTRDISINDILKAQTRNAELIVELIGDRESPILDVGCGIGGIDRLLLEAGMEPVALSPNSYQIAHVKDKYPKVELIESRFEDIPITGNEHRFGTIICSESMQYLDLDVSLPLMAKLLKPGGQLIVCDWFRKGEARDNSGHLWSHFEENVKGSGWTITQNADHTQNIVPLLRFIHMIGSEMLRPVFDFGVEKVRSMQPGVHYLLENLIDDLDKKIDKNLDIIDPDLFAEFKSYNLMVLKHDA